MIMRMNRYTTLLIGICFLIFGSSALAQRELGNRPTNTGGVPTYEQTAYDVKAYDIKLDVYPATKSITGITTIDTKIVQPLNVIVLDLDTPFEVSSVGQKKGDMIVPLKFERSPTQIQAHLRRTFQPGESVSIVVAYKGVPRVAPRPPWVGGFMWETTADGSPWIATAYQNDGADLMFPCKDIPSDKAERVTMSVTVPENLIAALPGKLVSETSNNNGTKTYKWLREEPISNYEIVLNIAPYNVITDSMTSVAGDQIPIVFYVLPEHANKGQQLIDDTKKYVAFFEKYLGPYPFRGEKLGIAETPHLGMEHSSIIAYGNNFKYNENGVDTLMLHELGHEWWANLVTATDWRDYWIHEGFQSFMDTLYIEEIKGKSAYLEAMKKRASATKNNQPIAPRDHKIAYQVYMSAPDYQASDGDIYGKGAVVLHSLRYLLGDEAFFKALRKMAYLDSTKEKVTDGTQIRFVNTDDFLTIAQDSAGIELDWFFEVYMRRAALPKLSVKDPRSGAKRMIKLKWYAPDNLPFNMPIDVRINGAIKRVEFKNNMASVAIPGGAKVEIDPDGWVLKAQ